MTQQPMERTQVDGEQQLYSRDADLDCQASPDGESTTRQEMKDEADINKMLSRFGVGAFQQRQATYGMVDFDVDLQTALHAIQEAKKAYSRMPEGLKDRYPTWQSVLNAVEDGSLTFDMTQPEPETITPKTPPEGVTE